MTLYNYTIESCSKGDSIWFFYSNKSAMHLSVNRNGKVLLNIDGEIKESGNLKGFFNIPKYKYTFLMCEDFCVLLLNNTRYLFNMTHLQETYTTVGRVCRIGRSEYGMLDIVTMARSIKCLNPADWVYYNSDADHDDKDMSLLVAKDGSQFLLVNLSPENTDALTHIFTEASNSEKLLLHGNMPRSRAYFTEVNL